MMVRFYFQTLAMLYKKKQHLLNSHILHLTFSLIGTVDSGKESSVIPNMSNLYRGPSIDAPYQVSVHLAEGFQNRRLKCEKLMDDRLYKKK
jgi:hypothetical protein